MKILNDLIGNRNRAFRRPTVPLRAPRMDYESRPITKAEVSIYGDVILSDKLHRFSLTSFDATGGSSSALVPLAGVHAIQFKVLQMLFGSYSPRLDNAL